MIPFLNLKKINEPFEMMLQEKMKQFLEGGWYILGNEVKTFEVNFASYCGAKYCIGVGNGWEMAFVVIGAEPLNRVPFIVLVFCS